MSEGPHLKKKEAATKEHFLSQSGFLPHTLKPTCKHGYIHKNIFISPLSDGGEGRSMKTNDRAGLKDPKMLREGLEGLNKH